MRKMLFCSSTLKPSTSMVLSSRRKSSASSLPGISQFPPCHGPPRCHQHPTPKPGGAGTQGDTPKPSERGRGWARWGAHNLVQVVVGLGALQAVALPLLGGQPRQHLVEDVVVALTLGLRSREPSCDGGDTGRAGGGHRQSPPAAHLEDHAGLLQQVLRGDGTADQTTAGARVGAWLENWGLRGGSAPTPAPPSARGGHPGPQVPPPPQQGWVGRERDLSWDPG